MKTRRTIEPRPHVLVEFCLLSWQLFRLKCANRRMKVVHFFRVRRLKGMMFRIKVAHFFRVLPLKVEILLLRLNKFFFERKQKFASLSVGNRGIEFVHEVNQVLDSAHVDVPFSAPLRQNVPDDPAVPRSGPSDGSAGSREE